MDDIEMRMLYQQLGEVIRGLQALSEMIEVRQAQAERIFELGRVDIVVVRQDQRDLEEKMDCAICIVQHDLEELRSGAKSAACAIERLVETVNELREPVSEIIAMRSRAAGVILGLGIIGSVLLWLVEPFYHWFVEQQYLKQ
jgi:hypothetical protein